MTSRESLWQLRFRIAKKWIHPRCPKMAKRINNKLWYLWYIRPKNTTQRERKKKELTTDACNNLDESPE